MHDDHVAPSSAGDARDRLIAMNPLDLFMNETDRELSRDQGTRQRETDSSPLLPVVHRKFESRLFTNSPVLAIRSRYLRYLAVLQRLYFRTNDALILLVRQRTFVFLDLFDTENKRSRIERIAQFSSFEIFNAVAPAPFHNSWPISNLLLRYTISVSRLSLSVFIPL